MLENYAEVLRSRSVFVGENGGTIVGLLVLSETDEGFTLENVAVNPHFSGQGLGRHLLWLAEQEAITDGHASIHLYTHEKMTRNIALYEKIGYVTYDRRTEGPYKGLHAKNTGFPLKAYSGRRQFLSSSPSRIPAFTTLASLSVAFAALRH